jgi:hypothetical protein
MPHDLRHLALMNFLLERFEDIPEELRNLLCPASRNLLIVADEVLFLLRRGMSASTSPQALSSDEASPTLFSGAFSRLIDAFKSRSIWMPHCS